MTIGNYFSLLGAHPWAIVALILTFGVAFINGWTDGPNVIATCVTSRALKPKPAILLCAIGNLIGTVLIGFLAKFMTGFADVSKTIAELVNFPVGNMLLDRAFIVIAGGLFAIIVWSLLSTKLGFPSSQSNGLIGGLSGAAIALAIFGKADNALSYLNLNPWIRVLIGFFGSMILGVLLGFLLNKLIVLLFRKAHPGPANRFFQRGQVASAALMSVVHGIQDGAKFIGVSLAITALLNAANGGAYDASLFSGVWYLFLPVALFIMVGTFMGGLSIIKTLGSGMVKLERYQSFATDIASIIGLLLATVFGLPVSTGSVKSMAIIGCGIAKNPRRVRYDKMGQMIGLWVAFFPLCGITAFLFVAIFIWTVR